MKIVRVKAQWRELFRDTHGVVGAELHQDDIVCLLVGVDSKGHICEGPWYGHSFAERQRYPFILKKPYDEVDWGYSSDDGRTNLGKKVIQVGERFDFNNAVFQITEVTPI